MDVRWDPTGGGQDAYRRAHIATAVYCDLDADLSGVGEGRHPLPDPTGFAQTLGRLGIAPDRPLVVYDDVAGAVAARLWWMLTSLGHQEVYLLDGGLAGWIAHGFPVASGEERPIPTRYPSPRAWEGVVDTEEVAASLGRAILVDARDQPRYLGVEEPIDPVAGHIPGAVNLPFRGNLDENGRFLPRERLRDRFAAVARPDTIVYCGSGVTACHDILAMVLAGLPRPLLYAGSWSAWIADPSRPVDVG